MDPNARKRLQDATREAVDQDIQRKASVVGRGPGPYTVMLVGGCDPTFFWVGLVWHVDDPTLLFCVPADEAPVAASSDICTDASSFPLTLRCSFGAWLPQPLLANSQVVGVVDRQVCSDALDMVARLVDGDVPYDPARDEDPELDLWQSRVATAADELARLRDRVEATAKTSPAPRSTSPTLLQRLAAGFKQFVPDLTVAPPIFSAVMPLGVRGSDTHISGGGLDLRIIIGDVLVQLHSEQDEDGLLVAASAFREDGSVVQGVVVEVTSGEDTTFRETNRFGVIDGFRTPVSDSEGEIVVRYGEHTRVLSW